MSISNDPLRSSSSLSQPPISKPLTSQPLVSQTETQSKPISNPSAFKPSTNEVSTVPGQELQNKIEARLDKVSETELQEVSEVIPKPLAMTERRSVFSETPPTPPPLPGKAQEISREDFGQLLIRPNFGKLCKELDRSIFGKDKVLEKAQAKGKQIAEMTPPGSDLMLTLVGASDEKLRDMVTHGIALTKTRKYGPDTPYEGLSRKKQKMVDAIVAGLKSGLPQDLQQLQKVGGKGDVGQIQNRISLNEQIRNAKIKGPSEETLQALDNYVDSKGIDQIKAKLKQDSESLRTELVYEDLPIPDPAETSLDVLGKETLTGLLPVNDSLKARTLQALSEVPESQRSGLLWTLGMKPFNETCDEVAKQIHGKPLSELSESEAKAVTDLSKTLVVASLEKLGPGEGNSLVSSGSDGPTEITHNGKTYDRVRKLGEGGFGVAFLFKERGGDDEVVVKRFKQDGKNDENWFGAMQDEIRTHRYAMGPQGMGHDNVLGLRGIVSRPPKSENGEHFGEIFTLTEVAKGGEMRDVMKNIHKEMVDDRISKTVEDLLKRQLFAQTIEGMHYIQKDRQMLHLDLKPENLFMTENGTVKVGDFGLANIGHETQATTGTMVYLSPETTGGGKIDYHSDTWTLGIIGRELFTGTRALPEGDIIPKKDAGSFRPMILLHEFGSDENNRIYHSGQEEGVAPTQFEGSDGVERPLQNLGGFHQLINAMQHPDPKQRPTLDVVRQHEFVSDPILSSEPVQKLLGILCKPSKDLNEDQLKARHQEIVDLNQEIENLVKH